MKNHPSDRRYLKVLRLRRLAIFVFPAAVFIGSALIASPLPQQDSASVTTVLQDDDSENNDSENNDSENNDDAVQAVNDLILRLDEANSLAAREEIESKLIELGPQAIPLLNSPPRGIRSSTRDALPRIRNAIEKNLLTKITEPTQISLTGNFTAAEILKRIETQTGQSYQLGDSVPSTLTNRRQLFDLEDEPYWIALDKVLDRFDLTLGALSRKSSWRIVARHPDSRPRSDSASYGGIVRGDVQWLQSFIDLSRPDQSLQRISLRFIWEPRFDPFEMIVDPGRLKVTDSDGEPLELLLTEQQVTSITSSQSHADIAIPIRLSPKKIRTIGSLKGTVQLRIPAGRAKFRFARLSSKPNQVSRVGNMLVSTEGYRLFNGQREVRMSFSIANAGQVLESHQGWMFRNQAYLQTKEGVKLRPTRIITSKQDGSEMGFRFLFPEPEDPDSCNFIYEAPSTISNVDVPFRFTEKQLTLD